MNIRIATAADAEPLIEFNQAMALETEGKQLDPATISSGVKSVFADRDKGFYVVAEDDGRIVGGLMITYEWSDWRAKVFWWIQSVYVHPDYRGRGVFRSLYRHVESLARQDAGVCGIRLYVHHDNHRAMTAYEKLGMTPADYRVYKADWSGLGKEEG